MFVSSGLHFSGLYEVKCPDKQSTVMAGSIAANYKSAAILEDAQAAGTSMKTDNVMLVNIPDRCDPAYELLMKGLEMGDCFERIGDYDPAFEPEHKLVREELAIIE